MTKRPRLIRYPITQQITLMRRLALYTHAGISLPRGLGFIAEDSTSISVKYILLVLEETVARGEPLSRGFAQFPKQFSRLTIGCIEMGEMGGSLTKTLSHLADILEKQASLNQKILGALAYPTIIILGTLGMASFLTLYIFPKILPILEGFHTKLPLPTRILLYLDKVLTYDWLWLGLFSLMLSMIAAFTLRNSIVRRHIENLLIRIPLFGTLYRYYALSILLRVFELLLSGGVRILPALILVRTSMPGSSYPSALLDIENHVAEGQQLSFALKRHPRLFPAVIAQMISAGEATGTLQQSLNSLAYLYENNFDNLTKNLTVLIEPVLMVFMGFIVGFVALAIITPIYGLTQSLSGTA